MAVQKAHRKIVSEAVKRLYDDGHKFKVEVIPPGSVVIFCEKDQLDSDEPDNYFVVIVYAHTRHQTKCAELQSGYHTMQHFNLLLDHGTDCVVMASITSLQV
jgi:UDP-N-acetylmuramyl tripeptide synthase